MQVANPNILTIKPYVPGKPIEDVKREFGLKSVVKLASNENPYPPSPKVLAALKKAALNINRYPDGSCFVLRQALAKFLKVAPGQLIFGNGSDEVIVLAVKAFVGQGDEVIIAQPSFLVYDLAARLAGARIEAVPLKNFYYDLDGIKARISSRTKVVFIGNPDNPCGTFLNGAQMEDLVKTASSRTLIFIDEAYFEYVQDKSYPDSLALVKKYPNVLVTRTFSKMYGLAGLRVGYGIGRPEVIDILNRLREPFNVNSLAQAAAVAALSDRGHYKKIARDVQEQRQFLYRSLAKLGVEHTQTYTNFILINVGGNSAALALKLLKKGVIVRDMNAWGMNGYVRVSIGTAVENKRFIKTLGEVL